VVGALIVVGVIFMLIVSVTGRQPFGAPLGEDAPEQEEVLTPVELPEDEAAEDGQQRPDE